jgi:hypothetical protein
MGIRSKLPALAAGLAILAAGCVHSDEGIALPDRDDSIFDASLLGEWEVTDAPFWSPAQPEPPGRVRIERQAAESNQYTFRPLPERRQDDPFSCVRGVRLFQLGDTMFLDYPFALPSGREPAGAEIPAMHFVRRLRMKGDRFVLDGLAVGFLKEHPAAIRHRIWGPFKGRVHITDSPEALRAFLVENVKNESAWLEESRTFFQKAKPSGQSPPEK